MRYTILSIILWTTLASAQLQANTTVPSTTNTASNTTARISHTTPVASPTPIEVLTTTTNCCQTTPGTPTHEITPTTKTPHRYNPVINITITAHHPPHSTPATSLVIDTRELSTGTNNLTHDSIEAATASQEQTEPSERTTTSAGIISATTNSALLVDIQNSVKGVKVGGDVAASACAFVVAIAALTWAFADLD